nr:MAG: hypothetical protein 2 [Leviviridae sp.]
MSLADPLSITVASTPHVCPRTSVEDTRSEYTSGDGLWQLSISHDYGKRTRRVFRVDTSKVAPDPFKPDENVTRTMSFYMVWDLPKVGYSATEAYDVFNGLAGLALTASGAAVVKILGGES